MMKIIRNVQPSFENLNFAVRYIHNIYRPLEEFEDNNSMCFYNCIYYNKKM